MAMNFFPETSAPSVLTGNRRAVEGHLDDDYYLRSFTPGMFVPFATAAHGTAGVTAGTVNQWPSIDFPDAAVSYATVAMRRPKFWVSGRLELILFYTSPTAGAANFSAVVQVGAVPKSGNLNTGYVTLLSSIVALAGPAAANDEQESAAIYTAASFDSSVRRFAFIIGRDGADANNNVFQVTELLVRHIPALNEVDVK